jgi:hypothetical protein
MVSKKKQCRNLICFPYSQVGNGISNWRIIKWGHRKRCLVQVDFHFSRYFRRSKSHSSERVVASLHRPPDVKGPSSVGGRSFFGGGLRGEGEKDPSNNSSRCNATHDLHEKLVWDGADWEKERETVVLFLLYFPFFVLKDKTQRDSVTLL